MAYSELSIRIQNLIKKIRSANDKLRLVNGDFSDLE